jgi:hypothetical protein
MMKTPQDFYRDRSRPDGLGAQCKMCMNEHDQNRRATNPEKYLADRRKRAYKHLLRTKFDLTVGEYEALLEQQGGVCALCKRPETAVTKDRSRLRMMSVDHCHTQGRVRALLCNDCNVGLGRFRDDPALLRTAASYIEQHRA